jgi:hypothetical protein
MGSATWFVLLILVLGGIETAVLIAYHRTQRRLPENTFGGRPITHSSREYFLAGVLLVGVVGEIIWLLMRLT